MEAKERDDAAAATCPLPGTSGPATWRETIATLAAMGGPYWVKAALYALGAAVAIGVPTVIIPNPLFVRDVGVTVADYVLFGLASLLIGVTWALPAGPRSEENRSVWGAFGTFLAVGCPTCNKIVLLLLGSSGALTYFAPVQPLLGIAALVLLVAALRRRVAYVRSFGSLSSP